MGESQNKNKSINKVELLKISCRKRKFTWTNILFHIVFIANIFKNSLIYLHNKEAYILTFTSAELLVRLQEASFRKTSELKDIDLLFHSYGESHTYAIFWTDKGNPKVLPKCLETLQLFTCIAKETTCIRLNSSIEIHVDFDSLMCLDFGSKRDLKKKDTGQINTVNIDTEIVYDIDDLTGRRNARTAIFPISNSRKNKVKVACSNWFQEEILYPFTGIENERSEFPQQISGEQENEEQGTIVFSNGASFRSVPGHQYRSLPDQSPVQAARSNQSPVPTSVADSFIPRYPEFTSHQDRIKSYARWTHRKPDPTELSEAGFFFTDQLDLVRCFQCGIGLKDFSEGDNPLVEHVRYSSRCHYLLEKLGQSQLSSIRTQLQMQDPEMNRQRQIEVSRGTRPEINYTVRHPEYQTLESRLRTFDKWPRHLIQTPRQLSEAGLYYIGFEDHVRCFACDGGLRRWDPEDDPWTEHCRWFPACPFARVEKGDNFIALIQASAYNGNEDNEDLSETMQQMTLRDPVYNAALNEHKDACLEMGYELTDFNEAVQEIRERGTILPQIDEILDTIEVVKERKRQELMEKKRQNETPAEENQRLKRLVICMLCGRNKVNALFLPCTHHRLCMECAELLTSCPLCHINIRQKIKTYLV